MIIKTDLFKSAILFLSKIGTNRIYKGLTLFYTENNTLFAELITDEAYSIRVIAGTNIRENFGFSVIIQKLEPLISNYDKEDFELEVRPNNLYIKTDVESLISLYGNKGSMNRIPSFEGDSIVDSKNLKFKDYKDFINNYLSCVHKDQDIYTYVYLKDKIIAYDQRCVRVSKDNLGFPYPLFVNKGLFDLISQMDRLYKEDIIVDFYNKRYEIKNNYCTIFVFRNNNWETDWEKNVLSIPINPEQMPENFGQMSENSGQPFFTVSKDDLVNTYDKYKYFLKLNNNGAILDISNKKILINSSEDKVSVPVSFGSTYKYANKKLNFERLYKIIEYCLDQITFKSGIQSTDYLYFENDKENVVLALTESE